MYIGIISMRYAKALLMYSNENRTADVVYKEVKILLEYFDKQPELKQVLGNPILSSEIKLKLICAAVADNKISKELRRFVELVLKERREEFLHFMFLSYIKLYRKQKNISIGKLTTAYPVTDKISDRICAMVSQHTHGTVEFKTRIDPKIEGGFILEIGTYRLDASVANQIKMVKQQFIDKNRRIV